MSKHDWISIMVLLMITWGEAGRSAHITVWAELLKPDFVFGFLVLSGVTIKSWLYQRRPLPTPNTSGE